MLAEISLRQVKDALAYVQIEDSPQLIHVFFLEENDDQESQELVDGATLLRDQQVR